MFREYIFTKPSFLSGAAKVVDVGGSLTDCDFLFSFSPAEADSRAIASDFRVTGNDLYQALDEHAAESEETSAQAA